jgi:hypothetical protein
MLNWGKGKIYMWKHTNTQHESGESKTVGGWWGKRERRCEFDALG